jgi:UPF0755 protein
MRSILNLTSATHTTPFFMRKFAIPIILGLIVIGFIVGYQPLKSIYFSNVPAHLNDEFICIPTGSSFEDVVLLLKRGNYIKDENGFRWLAKQMKFDKPVMRAGRFKIQPGWSNRDLIQHLRTGEQAPVKVVLNSERLPEDIAGKVSRFIETDSFTILSAFRNTALLSELGYTPETVIAMCIPNTYEMYWNTDGPTFLRRLAKEQAAFWNKNDRLTKAKNMNLTPTQIYTLASIVERETNANAEKPTVAGVYLNRLRIGMRLQADPTAVFATRDFATHRVTQYHTSFNSPYNTYIYTGLPPGPISMASIPSIDAVLNPEKHNYIYFCAKPDDSGTHAFASTLPGHNVNVEKFRAWMKVRGY